MAAAQNERYRKDGKMVCLENRPAKRIFPIVKHGFVFSCSVIPITPLLEKLIRISISREGS